MVPELGSGTVVPRAQVVLPAVIRTKKGKPIAKHVKMVNTVARELRTVVRHALKATTRTPTNKFAHSVLSAVTRHLKAFKAVIIVR